MLLKQICQSVGLPMERNFEEARLLVAYYHEFKDSNTHIIKYRI